MPDAGSASGAVWVDNHCHLPAAAGDRAEVVAEARAAGVTRIVTVGCDEASSRDCTVAAAASVDAPDGVDVWATVGVHPHDARTVVDPDGAVDLAPVEALLAEPRVVAVGECGLDYFYDHSPREQQREVFAAQIALAHRLDLALVVHTRDAWADTFAILAAEGVPARTVFHCFTGGPDEARRGLDLGIRLSFSGIVTFKSAGDLRAAAALCPADRLLVETDAPYLAPEPHRGRRNRPALLPVVGAAVAAVKGVSADEVAAASWQTACELYRLP